MGRASAKMFPAPVAFGDSQMNTIRQAQAPDLIQQQQLPSLNFLNQGTGLPRSGPAATNTPAMRGGNPFRSMLRPYYNSQ